MPRAAWYTPRWSKLHGRCRNRHYRRNPPLLKPLSLPPPPPRRIEDGDRSPSRHALSPRSHSLDIFRALDTSYRQITPLQEFSASSSLKPIYDLFVYLGEFNYGWLTILG